MEASECYASFEHLVHRYHGEIHAYCTRMLRDAAAAEDLTQETFLRAYRAYHLGPPVTNGRAWLYKIATHACLNELRGRARERAAHSRLASEAPVPPADPDEALVLRELVAALPPKQRAALVLRRYHALPYEAIGQALACSPAAARANVYQALKHLRAALDVGGEGGQP